jgi:micrococcal nuclease
MEDQVAPSGRAWMEVRMAPDGRALIEGRVVWVVDGDTIHVRVGARIEKVRYIGINAPEIPHERRWWREGGALAHAANRQLVARQAAALELDVERRDDYGRLLAYVWVPRELMPVRASSTPRQRTDVRASAMPREGADMRVGAMPSERAAISGSAMPRERGRVMANAEMVRQGFAQVMTIPPNAKYRDHLLALQREAREAGRGLWRRA